MSDIPEWAFDEAVRRMACKDGGAPLSEEWVRWNVPARAIRAFARYIAEHEETPVDPLLIEAREIAKASLDLSSHARCNCRAEIDRGEWDNKRTVKAALAALKRGMELAKDADHAWRAL